MDTLKKIARDYGLTPKGVRFALEQYQIIITEIIGGMLSKLTYNAKDILSFVDERKCKYCEYKSS